MCRADGGTGSGQTVSGWSTPSTLVDQWEDIVAGNTSATAGKANGTANNNNAMAGTSTAAGTGDPNNISHVTSGGAGVSCMFDGSNCMAANSGAAGSVTRAYGNVAQSIAETPVEGNWFTNIFLNMARGDMAQVAQEHYAHAAVQDGNYLEAAVILAPIVIEGIALHKLNKVEVAGTGPIQEGEVVTYREFLNRSVVGDNIEGHEVWQHANLKANNLATTRLGTTASADNPVIALHKDVHKLVNAEQRALNAASQSPRQNIRANAQILRNVGVANESTISQIENMAIQHAKSLGF